MANDNGTIVTVSAISNYSYHHNYLGVAIASFLFQGDNCVHSEFVAWMVTKFIETFVLVVLFLLLVYKYKNGKSDETKKGQSRVTSATIPRAKVLLPFHLPFIDGFYTMYKIRIDGVKLLENMVEQFGKLFEASLGSMNVFVVSDVSIAQKILMSDNLKHLNKPGYIYDKIFVDGFSDGLANSKYETWTSHRRMLARLFSYKSLQSYLQFMNLHARNLVTGLSLQGSKLEGEKVWALMHCHSFKIISQLVLGYETLSDEAFSQFNQSFVRLKQLVIERLFSPQLQFQPFWYFHPKRKEYQMLSRNCDAFIKQTVERYRNAHEKKLKNNHNGEDGPAAGDNPFKCLIKEMLDRDATDKEIYDEVATFIAMGHETTLTALQMLLVNLALNPGEQALCREEVDKLAKIKSNAGGEEDLSMEDLSSLEYLERCIFESGRLTTTVPAFLRRLDAPLKISEDLELPAGSNVAINSWAMHRDPEIFPNPEKFDPDRFLPENVKQRRAGAFMPFSGGPRNCIGWKVAIMEIKVMMTWILRNFDISTTDKLQDVKLLFDVTIAPERTYNIILRKRN